MKRNLSTTSKSSTPTVKPSSKLPQKSTGKPTSNKTRTPAKKAVTHSPGVATSPPSPPQSDSKQSQLIALLRSESGASMPQMQGLTGWLPHTVRGMLSGSLRKRLGLDVQHQIIDGVRVYRIVEVPVQ